MLIQSILTYLVFAFQMYFLAKYSRKSEILKKRSDSVFFLLVAIILFSSLSGVRYRVGSDCEEYAEAYQILLDGKLISNSLSLSKAEPGFLFISKIMALLHLPRFIYMGFLAFLEISFLTLAFKRRKYLLPFVYIILILGPFYNTFMNGVRQMIVACIFVYLVQELVDYRKWLKYIIVVLLTLMLHKSALYLIPFVFVMFYKKSPNVLLCMCLLIGFTILGNISFVKDYIMTSESLLRISGYASYADNLENYANMDSGITSFGPRSIVTLLSNITVILLSSKVARRFKGDRFFKVSFLFFMIYVCGVAILGTINLLFARPLLYFFPFVLICQAYTLKYLFLSSLLLKLKKSKIKVSQKSINLVPYIVAFLFCSYSILENIAVRNTPEETCLFKFIL